MAVKKKSTGDVAWTRKLEKLVFARKGRLPPHVIAWEPGDKTAIAMAWANVDVYMLDGPKQLDAARAAAKLGKAKVKGAIAKATDGALAIVRKEPAKLDVDVEAASQLLELRMSSALELWEAVHGATFALRVMLAISKLRVEGNAKERWLVESDAKPGAALDGQRVNWEVLRLVLATATDKEVATARAVADKARKGADAYLRAALAFAFADEAWAKDATTALIAAEKTARGEGDTAWQMLMATASVADATKLAALQYSLTQPYGVTLVANHGAAAAPVLAALRATPEVKALRKMLAT